MTGVKDAAECYLQHWISKMSIKYGNTYKYVIISKDHILINIKNVLIDEGLEAVFCDDEQSIKSALYSP